MEDSQKELLLRMLDLDPEARPSVREIFNYVRALAKSEPTPPLVLSDEAKIWKGRRMEAEKKRDMKVMKKVKTPIVPNRIHKNKTLDPNSIAAKRLAVKRGNTLSSTDVTIEQLSVSPTPSSSSPQIKNSACNCHMDSSADFDVNFDSSTQASTTPDQSFEARFIGNTSFFETLSLPSDGYVTPDAVIESSVNINVSTLEARTESSPDKSLNISVNKSLIDLDY
jgi:hypothetical protein